MSGIWIVHRDAGARAALTRLAAAPEETILGGPRDPIFDLSSDARAVVLGLAGDDIELELEFVHRTAPRLPGARWIIVSDGVDPAPLGRLFQGVPLVALRWPPHADELRAALGESRAPQGIEALPRRRHRSRLQMRFARWFGDLDLPALARAVDPANAHVPLLVRGELGTGRELLARYVHTFGSPGPQAPFLSLHCEARTSERDLLDRIQASFSPTELQDSMRGCTLWLDELDRLPRQTQRAVQTWIEFGIPRGPLVGLPVRFAASVSDGPSGSLPALEAGLLAAFGGLGIRIPPLRERSYAIESVATDVFRSAPAETEGEGERVRGLAPSALELLQHHPWPENLRELESVLLRTLAACDADPIEAHHLCFEPVSPVGNGAPQLRPERSTGEPPTVAPTDDDIRSEAERALDDVVRRAAAKRAEMQRGEPEAPWPPQAPEEPWIDFDRRGALRRAEHESGDAQEPTEEPIYLDDPDAALDQTFAGLEPEAPTPGQREARAEWVRLVRALAHELRNPLVSARTLVELLPEHHADPDFRERMGDLVGADVRRVEQLMNKLEGMLASESGPTEEVNLSELFVALLEEKREKVQQRRLLVLRELEQEHPIALADAARLRATLDALIDLALDRVQERGDVYFATRHHPTAMQGGPALRLLIRFSREAVRRAADGASLSALAEASDALRDTSETGNSVDLALAETAVRQMGGHFTIDDRASETVILVDLPAPSGPALRHRDAR